jgi:hypothetical protein
MSVLDSKLNILKFEDISSGMTHELDGCFNHLPSLDLNECLQSGVVRLVDNVLSSLRFDNMINEIWVGK